MISVGKIRQKESSLKGLHFRDLLQMKEVEFTLLDFANSIMLGWQKRIRMTIQIKSLDKIKDHFNNNHKKNLFHFTTTMELLEKLRANKYRVVTKQKSFIQGDIISMQIALPKTWVLDKIKNIPQQWWSMEQTKSLKSL